MNEAEKQNYTNKYINKKSVSIRFFGKIRVLLFSRLFAQLK